MSYFTFFFFTGKLWFESFHLFMALSGFLAPCCETYPSWRLKMVSFHAAGSTVEKNICRKCYIWTQAQYPPNPTPPKASRAVKTGVSVCWLILWKENQQGAMHSISCRRRTHLSSIKWCSVRSLGFLEIGCNSHKKKRHKITFRVAQVSSWKGIGRRNPTPSVCQLSTIFLFFSFHWLS